ERTGHLEECMGKEGQFDGVSAAKGEHAGTGVREACALADSRQWGTINREGGSCMRGGVKAAKGQARPEIAKGLHRGDLWVDCKEEKRVAGYSQGRCCRVEFFWSRVPPR
ncbi:hypothetical protein GOP47_0022314, partial [Adiantum capillus-veneris]